MVRYTLILWMLLIQRYAEATECYFYENGLHMYCADINSLDALNAEIRKGLTDNNLLNDNIELLKIIRCDLESFTIDSIGKWYKLKDLRFIDSNISSLTSDAFVNLEALEVIGIDNSDIEYIDKNCFNNLKTLKGLILRRNKNLEIFQKYFSDFASLESLGLIGDPAIEEINEDTFFVV
ncbi:hypothetical protein ILUMI_19934, partial [Ignelater luminosus]